MKFMFLRVNNTLKIFMVYTHSFDFELKLYRVSSRTPKCYNLNPPKQQ
jgi:hypothetical protein